MPAESRDSSLVSSDSFFVGKSLMGSKPLFVLFISSGNAARSQIAQTLLNAKGSHSYKARSAGVTPIDELPFTTKALLQKEGYDTQKLFPKTWEDFHAAAGYLPVDVIVTLSEDAKAVCQEEWPGDPVCVHWVVDNPLGAERPDQQEWKYRKCMAILEKRIDALVKGRPITSPCEALLRFKDIGMVV